MFLRVLAAIAIAAVVLLLLPTRKLHIREPRGGGQVSYRGIIIFVIITVIAFIILGLLGLDPSKE